MHRHPGIRAAAIGTLSCAALLLGGCNNIWEWSRDEGSYETLVAEGREAMQQARYDVAVEKLADAVALDPARGEARYYFAKASVLHADLDVISLITTITDDVEGGGGARAIFDFAVLKADRVYGVNRTVIQALDPIHTGQADTERLGNADVGLDLAIAYTLRGILRLRDTNGDGVIDANDLDISEFSLGGDGGYSLEGVENVDPDDLNGMIEDLSDLLESGGELVDEILQDIDGSAIDSESLDQLIEDLGGDLSAFYVNTGTPGNPGEGDNDGDGSTDEECRNGIDDDGDGLVDEDTRVFSCP